MIWKKFISGRSMGICTPNLTHQSGKDANMGFALKSSYSYHFVSYCFVTNHSIVGTCCMQLQSWSIENISSWASGSFKCWLELERDPFCHTRPWSSGSHQWHRPLRDQPSAWCASDHGRERWTAYARFGRASTHQSTCREHMHRVPSGLRREWSGEACSSGCGYLLRVLTASC